MDSIFGLLNERLGHKNKLKTDRLFLNSKQSKRHVQLGRMPPHVPHLSLFRVRAEHCDRRADGRRLGEVEAHAPLVAGRFAAALGRRAAPPKCSSPRPGNSWRKGAMIESTTSYKAGMKAVQLGGVLTTAPASTPNARKKTTINAVSQGDATLPTA